MGRLLSSTVKTEWESRREGKKTKQCKKNLNEAKKADCPLEVTTGGAGGGGAVQVQEML